MSTSLKGIAVFLTGATSGIGLVTAKALAEAGATLFIHGRDKGKVQKLRAELSAIGREVRSFIADLSSLEETARLGTRGRRSGRLPRRPDQQRRGRHRGGHEKARAEQGRARASLRGQLPGAVSPDRWAPGARASPPRRHQRGVRGPGAPGFRRPHDGARVQRRADLLPQQACPHHDELRSCGASPRAPGPFPSPGDVPGHRNGAQSRHLSPGPGKPGRAVHPRGNFRCLERRDVGKILRRVPAVAGPPPGI